MDFFFFLNLLLNVLARRDLVKKLTSDQFTAVKSKCYFPLSDSNKPMNDSLLVIYCLTIRLVQAEWILCPHTGGSDHTS